MKRITLRNQKELESLKNDSSRVNSIDELLLRKVLEESLQDNGIDNFKEITNLNNISFGHFILIEKILSVEKLSPDERVAMISPIAPKDAAAALPAPAGAALPPPSPRAGAAPPALRAGAALPCAVEQLPLRGRRRRAGARLPQRPQRLRV